MLLVTTCTVAVSSGGVMIIKVIIVAMAGLNTAKEERFAKLKTSYLKLRDEHVQLLREEGDVRKQLTSLQVAVTQEDANKKVTCHICLYSISHFLTYRSWRVKSNCFNKSYKMLTRKW